MSISEGTSTVSRALLSRQSICSSDRTIVGYELLFRDDDQDRAAIRDQDEATAQVIVNTFMEIGLDEMVGSSMAFINVSPKFLLSDFCEALPPNRIVLELLEPIDADPAFVSRLR